MSQKLVPVVSMFPFTGGSRLPHSDTVCVHVCTSITTRVCVCVRRLPHVCACVYVRACVYIHQCLCVCACVRMSMYVCVYIHTCACVCACVCTSIHVHVCVQLNLLTLACGCICRPCPIRLADTHTHAHDPVSHVTGVGGCGAKYSSRECHTAIQGVSKVRTVYGWGGGGGE